MNQLTSAGQEFLKGMDPFIDCHFYVEIGDGHGFGRFKEVALPSIKNESQSFFVGGVNDRKIVLPGRSYMEGELKIGKGLVAHKTLLDWQMNIVNGYIQTENVTVCIVGANYRTLIRLSFQDTYPVAWTGPGFKADGGGQVFIESLSLAHAGMVTVSYTELFGAAGRAMRAAGDVAQGALEVAAAGAVVAGTAATAAAGAKAIIKGK